MKEKKTTAIWLGITAAYLLTLGLFILLFPKWFTLVLGSVTACINLALGMVFPNVCSIVSFFIGLGVTFVPKAVTGILLMMLGVAGIVYNLCDRHDYAE